MEIESGRRSNKASVGQADKVNRKLSLASETESKSSESVVRERMSLQNEIIQ